MLLVYRYIFKIISKSCVNKPTEVKWKLLFTYTSSFAPHNYVIPNGPTLWTIETPLIPSLYAYGDLLLKRASLSATSLQSGAYCAVEVFIFLKLQSEFSVDVILLVSVTSELRNLDAPSAENKSRSHLAVSTKNSSPYYKNTNQKLSTNRPIRINWARPTHQALFFWKRTIA